MSPLINKYLEPTNSNAGDHLLFFNYSAIFYDFSILTLENKNFLIELKETLFRTRDQPFLNVHITSALLSLSDRP